ncbi:MAG: hypothetical protein ACE5K0_01265 [Candidatus Methanofastidiosia archaeon]
MDEKGSYYCSSCESVFHYRCLLHEIKREKSCPNCRVFTYLWNFKKGFPDSFLFKEEEEIEPEEKEELPEEPEEESLKHQKPSESIKDTESFEVPSSKLSTEKNLETQLGIFQRKSRIRSVLKIFREGKIIDMRIITLLFFSLGFYLLMFSGEDSVQILMGLFFIIAGIACNNEFIGNVAIITIIGILLVLAAFYKFGDPLILTRGILFSYLLLIPIFLIFMLLIKKK